MEARETLSRLADAAAGRATSAPPSIDGDRDAVAAWLIRHDLAGLAHAALGPVDARLADALRPAAWGIAAENLAHFDTLARIEDLFARERIPLVLLKGAALAGWAYGDPSLRAMSDLDLWVPAGEMRRAVDALLRTGLRQVAGLPDRPPELQARSGGELVFRHAAREHGVVELHYSAFQGWWARRAAAPDDGGAWRRAVPMGPGRHARRLAAEDAALHASFHLVVNQFRQAPLRGLMDLGVLARAADIDWSAVASRARAFRLGGAIWLALDRAEAIVGLPGASAALDALRPKAPRAAALRFLVPIPALLAGRDLGSRARRHALMLLLAERPRDRARLVGRTLWPEDWWIDARYGGRVGRLGHLLGLLRRGEV